MPMPMPILIPTAMLPSRRQHASALRDVTEFESQDAVDRRRSSIQRQNSPMEVTEAVVGFRGPQIRVLHEKFIEAEGEAKDCLLQ